MDPNNNVEGANLLEKTNAIPLFRRVQDVTIFIGLVELMFLLLIIFIRFCFKVVSCLRMTAQCVRAISAILTSTRFVFLLGNVIVIALFVIAGRYPPEDDEPSCDDHVRVEYVEKCHFNPPPSPPPPPHIVEEQKEAEDVHPCNVPCVDKEVIISHTPSEKIVRPAALHAVARRRKARRGRIENIRRVGAFYGRKDWVSAWASASASAFTFAFAPAPAPVPAPFRRYAEDDMTSEEFRRKVEDYIARQRRSLREEKLAGLY